MLTREDRGEVSVWLQCGRVGQLGRERGWMDGVAEGSSSSTPPEGWFGLVLKHHVFVRE